MKKYFRIRLKYDQISDSVDRFDLYLRKENVCQIMRSLVRESQSSKFASTVNRESLETLVKNIRDEVDTISAAATTTTTNNAKRSSEVDSAGSNLLDEFNQFETNFTSRVLGSSTNPPPPQTIIRLGILIFLDFILVFCFNLVVLNGFLFFSFFF